MDETERKTVKSTYLHKSRWISLVDEEVRMPDGRTAHYDVVERSDVAVAVAKDGEYFYMVRQFRHASGKMSLEFPQGFCEEGEEPIEDARRELSEEVGLMAKKLHPLGSLWVSAGFLRQRLFIFTAEDFERTRQNLDETEEISIVRLKLQDIRKAITDGSINNAPTVAALGLYLVS